MKPKVTRIEPELAETLRREDPNAYNGDASRNVHAAAASTWRLPDGSLAFKRWEDYVPAFES